MRLSCWSRCRALGAVVPMSLTNAMILGVGNYVIAYRIEEEELIVALCFTERKELSPGD